MDAAVDGPAELTGLDRSKTNLQPTRQAQEPGASGGVSISCGRGAGERDGAAGGGGVLPLEERTRERVPRQLAATQKAPDATLAVVKLRA